MATNIFIVFLPLILIATMAESETQSSTPPPQQASCVAELVAFSPCLPYVSAPPNNATDFVAPQCCNVFASAFEYGNGYCFCYILRQPLIFGFPLNETRVASLSSFCMLKNNRSSDLNSLCSPGAPALPPLSSTTDSGELTPSNSGSENNTLASMRSHPASPVSSPTIPSSSEEQVIVSSATNQIYYNHGTWFLHGMMIFLLNYIHF